MGPERGVRPVRHAFRDLERTVLVEVPEETIAAEIPERGGEERTFVLMCSTCDEPFVPEFPRRCEWCGHEFADGYDVEPKVAEAAESITGRGVAVITVLLVLLLGVTVYFFWIV